METKIKTPRKRPEQVSGASSGISIGKKWKVGADSLNIILYKKKRNKETGEPYWQAHSYYSTIKNALIGLVQQGVRDTKLASLKTLSNRIEQLCKEVK